MFFPYRDENPRRDVPYQTIGLIVLNVGLFIALNVWGEYRQIVRHYGLVPAHPSLLTALTSQFLHAGIGHLFGNMWFLWLFGDNVEDALGPTWFLPFYLGCGLMAGVLHTALSGGPSAEVPAIGASGAISGVLGAYLMLYPRARISCFTALGFFVFLRTSMRAIYFIGLWFVLQLVGVFFTRMAGVAGGIAYWAHIGGFLFGAGLLWPIREQLLPAAATVASGPEGLLPAGKTGGKEMVQGLRRLLAVGDDSRTVESSVELARRFPDADLPFEADLRMAESLERAGQLHLALVRYHHLLRRAGTRDRTADLYRRVANVCRRTGRPGQALQHLKQAERLGAAVGDEIARVHAELEKTDIGMTKGESERYLVIQQTEDAPPVPRAARIIARRTGRSFTDTAIKIRAFPGILADGLDFATAQTMAMELQAHGIWVLVVPERLRAEPPPALEMNRIDITPDGLACLPWLGERFFLPWREVDLLACGGVRWRRQKVEESPGVQKKERDFQAEVVTPFRPSSPHYEVVTKKGVTWFLDIYGLDPPRHVRVNPGRFDFHSLEQQIANTQEQNFAMLVERLTRAAPDVPVTPGLLGFLVGEGEEQHTFADARHFERHAAWYLTRLRATQVLYLTTPGAVAAAIAPL